MPDPPVRAAIPAGRIIESPEYRATHFRVYDEDGFASSFATTCPESATLASVTTYLSTRFEGRGGTGYDSKDLVVLLGHRIVAVVRAGADGRAVVTTFQV